MVWTSIPNSDIDADSPITTGLMTALRDNVTAQANGDSGAPKNTDASFSTNTINANKLSNSSVTSTQIASNTIGQGQIGSNAVGQSELKTTTSSQSLSLPVGTTSTLSLTGGVYGFNAGARSLNYSFTNYRCTGGAASYATTESVIHNDSSTHTAYFYHGYVQASPPYNLGDGDIPLFVYIVVDNSSGEAESISVAPEASWHYNGHTDIRATRKDNVSGRSWKEVPQIISDLNDANLTKQEAVRLGVYTRDVITDRLLSDNIVEMEITQNIKQADMNIIPHPYTFNNLRGKTVVMLDPVSPLTEKLLYMHESGEDVLQLIEGEKITFGNTALSRAMPSGVMAVDFTL